MVATAARNGCPRLDCAQLHGYARMRCLERAAAECAAGELPDASASGTFAAMNDDASRDNAAWDDAAIGGNPTAETAPTDEAALLAALQAGDEAAFETLLRDYGGPMLAVARRMLRNEADAADAVQDAFLSAFKSIDGFAGDAKLGTWLHRIVVNACLMKLRTRRRKPAQQIDDLLPQFLEDGHHASGVKRWRETVEQALDRKELSQLVRESIDELPHSHREVLLLRDIEQHDTAETAELLGISEGAVKTRLHRARQALRELLNPYLEGESL